jgi:hypothetical protein
MTVFELSLMITTIAIAPLKLQALWRRYFTYTLLAAIVWFGFCILEMIWWPEPGIGVWFLGFLSWIIGSAILVSRIQRQKQHCLRACPRTSGAESQCGNGALGERAAVRNRPGAAHELARTRRRRLDNFVTCRPISSRACPRLFCGRQPRRSLPCEGGSQLR